MDKGQRALDEIRNIALAQADVKRLSKDLQSALHGCKGVKGRFEYYGEDGEWKDGDDVTHLHAAYEPEVIDDEIYYLSDAEIREELAICPACLCAHDLAQQRKAAKRRLATARMRITMIGRGILKQEQTA